MMASRRAQQGGGRPASAGFHLEECDVTGENQGGAEPGGPARPRSCREFFCSWLVDPNLGPEWKPEVCRFVLSADATHRAILVTVDPGRPLAWKRDPHYAGLKQFSEIFFRI